MKRTLPAIFASLAAFALFCANADAATIDNGTKILCVLHKGAVIIGHVFDVTPPAGTQRARIGFLLDYIQFANGTKAQIHAAVVQKNVTQYNTATMRQEQIKFSLPAMPQGTVTPGPVAWQMHFTPGSKPSVTPPPKGNTGGYIYAQNPNENIVVPPGSPVTITLTASLDTP